MLCNPAHVAGLYAFGSFYQVKAHPVATCQVAVAVTVNRFVMDEGIVTAAVWNNETVPSLLTESLHCA